MRNRTLTFFFIFICFCFSAAAQEDETDPNQSPPPPTSTKTKKNKKKTKKDGLKETLELEVDTTNARRRPKNPLAPAKAAFYSAILPGLGQAYNKRYWKVPIVYAAIGAGVYFYIDNNNELNRYRDAFKRRLAGFDDDEFNLTITDDGLINAQETLRRNKELSLLVTVGLYVLNIIDANVDAHLLQFNIDDDLTFKPHYKINDLDQTGSLGLTMNFKID